MAPVVRVARFVHAFGFLGLLLRGRRATADQHTDYRLQTTPLATNSVPALAARVRTYLLGFHPLRCWSVQILPTTGLFALSPSATVDAHVSK
jgi:hypothetical protein